MVPTARMLAGNFSMEFSTTPLINPAAEGCVYTTGNPLCGAYPGNQITSINPSAKPFLSFFPTPNFPSTASYTTIAAAQAGADYISSS
jgi:hypothetical protein